MDGLTKKQDTSHLSVINSRKKMIVLGIIICLVVALIPAIGLHLIASDTNPSDFDSTFKTETDINTSENKTVESMQDNSTDSIVNESIETEEIENNTKEDDNQNINNDLEESDSNHNDNSGSGTTSGGGSYTPPSSGGNSGSPPNDPTEDEDSTSSSPEDCIVDLPPYSIIAKVDLTMDISYFITNLTGIFDSFDIENGSYLTWCIDYGEYMNYSQKNVTLYSTYCPPEQYQLPPENWSAVNYIINNKPENVSYNDIQTAIWYYANFGTEPEEPTPKAWDIIDEVETNNGTTFVPSPGDRIAIIVESDLDPTKDQLSIIENPLSTIPGPANLTLNKTVQMSTANIGDIVNYTYIVTNTGETSVESLALSDDKLGTILLNQTILAPGEWTKAWKKYTIKETDLPGPLVNTAVVTGLDTYTNQTVNDTDSCSLCLSYHSSIKIVKNAENENATLGSTVNYTYQVYNNGDVTLENVQVTDDKIGTISLNSTILSPNEWAIGESSYTITCPDMNNETLINIAFVNATTCFNESLTNQTTEEISLSYQPNITIDKTVLDKYDDSWHDELTVIEESYVLFHLTIKNTGKEPLHDIIITDILPEILSYEGNASLPPSSNNTHEIEWSISILQPNETCNISYTALANSLGVGQNNASTIVETCNSMLIVNDSVTISVLPCPSEVFINYAWMNQTDVTLDNPELIYHYNAFNNISQGIDAVCECGTVHVLNGLYAEQLFINKNISLVGENTYSTQLHMGNNPKTIHIPESSEFITPVVCAYGGSLTDTNMIVGSETISFSIQGFTLLSGSLDSSTSIMCRNVHQGCIENAIKNVSISNNPHGIQFWNCSQVLIDKNQVENTDNGLLIDALSDYITVTHNWFLDNDNAIILKDNSIQLPSEIKIKYNYIDTHCSNDYGLINEIAAFTVEATHNWWGSADGPTSPPGQEIIDPITGRLAESVDGEYITGDVHFDTWAGAGAVSEISHTEAPVGTYIYFDASESWVKSGSLGPEDWNSENENYVLDGSSLSISQYQWDFGDGTQGYQRTMNHKYTTPGIYEVMLRIRSADVYLDRCDGFRPSEDGIIYGYVYYTIHITE